MGSLGYTVVISVLSPQDGGEFLARIPDLPGCMSDGETREEAARSIEEAIRSWIDEAEELGRPVPDPSGEALTAV